MRITQVYNAVVELLQPTGLFKHIDLDNGQLDALSGEIPFLRPACFVLIEQGNIKRLGKGALLIENTITLSIAKDNFKPSRHRKQVEAEGITELMDAVSQAMHARGSATEIVGTFKEVSAAMINRRNKGVLERGEMVFMAMSKTTKPDTLIQNEADLETEVTLTYNINI